MKKVRKTKIKDDKEGEIRTTKTKKQRGQRCEEGEKNKRKEERGSVERVKTNRIQDRSEKRVR